MSANPYQHGVDGVDRCMQRAWDEGYAAAVADQRLRAAQVQRTLRPKGKNRWGLAR